MISSGGWRRIATSWRALEYADWACGSVARGEANQDSDVDVLVEFDRTPDLFELAALKERLAEILERPVDLATPQGLKPRLRDRILHEVRYAA
jgi:uncharacterized protein